jgi:monothiol glutaredoxin
MSELADQIQDIVENEPVALFMKGTPTFAACGNSQRALDALRSVGAPVAAVNILPDPRIRAELSELYGWPRSRRSSSAAS